MSEQAWCCEDCDWIGKAPKTEGGSLTQGFESCPDCGSLSVARFIPYQPETCVTLYLQPDQAQALAALSRRLWITECRMNATNEDEAHLMMGGLKELSDALAEAGYGGH